LKSKVVQDRGRCPHPQGASPLTPYFEYLKGGNRMKYTLIEERQLPEMKSVGRMYEHTSGAKLLHIENDDENKVFNVSFRTPPADDTGLPHILEHCVLNGSKNYPVKDPFFTLNKGSLITFLNAMTAADTTLYPVASYNQKDFLNLMGVYLDAVYKPMIHERELSFLQEGWHYVLQNPEDELSINGVVYSEMKGAYSSPDSRLYMAQNRQMFPDSHYRFSSGGFPGAIPDLDYETFKHFHKVLYNPANSFIYLYGDMDINKCFDLLDSYLSDAENKRDEVEKAVNKPVQTPLSSPVYGTYEYSINEQDDPEGKNYLGATYAYKEFPDPTTFVGYEILTHLLMYTPASPLYNTLLEQQMGESISGWSDTSILSPSFSLIIQNSKYTAEELVESVDEIIKEVIEEGFDKKFVESCLNAIEFRMREKDSWAPRGLMALMSRGRHWVYGKNPMDYFSPIEELLKIREKVTNGEAYFENLAKEIFIDNPHSSFVTLKAKPGLQAEEEVLLKSQLAERKKSFTEAQINEIIEKKATLDEWQNTPDTPEQIATIPLLTLDDVSKKAGIIPLAEEKISDTKVLFADIETDGIIYKQFFFDIGNLEAGEIPYISIISSLFARLDTKKRSYQDLVSEISFNLGGLYSGFTQYTDINNNDFVPFVKVVAKSLGKNIADIYRLAAEVMTETLYEDRDRIKMLLGEQKAEMEYSFINNGSHYASMRNSAYLSSKDAYWDLTSGIGFYDFLKDIMDNFDSKFEMFREKIYAVNKKIFSRTSLTMAMAGADLGASEKFLTDFRGVLSEGFVPTTANIVLPYKNEAFIAETKVNYNALVYKFGSVGENFNGHLSVLNRIINNDYLLQEIRVKGGAYGFSSSLYSSGVGQLSSYRDPNLDRTYDIYKKVPEFIENLKLSDRDMLQHILGAVNNFDKPAAAEAKLGTAISRYFDKITPERLQTQRDEILSTTAAKINSYVPMLAEGISKGLICTFGSEADISANKAMFERLVKL